MLSKQEQEKLMKLVIKEAQRALENGDNLFAAVLLDSEGNIVEIARNMQNSADRTQHVKVVLVGKSSKKLHKLYLEGYSVIVNSEPCSMCISLLIKTKIDTVYYGAPLDEDNDPFISSEEIAQRAKHKVRLVGGILEKECQNIISTVRGRKFSKAK